MKKICVITAARSEYGVLRWLISDIDKSLDFELQLVVTGGHLLKEQGNTIEQIEKDGFIITEIVDEGLDTTTQKTIAEYSGRLGQSMATCFDKLKPDYVLVLGDRYELLPICTSALIMKIPIIHISGGDVTEGAIDDAVRNSVTMMADYHFPGTIDSAENIIRMRGSDKNVWPVGEPGLDSFNRESLLSRYDLAVDLNLDINKSWGLMTLHAESKKSIEYSIETVKNCLEILLDTKTVNQLVVTYANADYGGRQINELIEEYSRYHDDVVRVVPSLGHLRYLSFMKQAELVIGNSSSGIIEAPMLGIPVINIGDRQKGRHQCSNIIQCGSSKRELEEALLKVNVIKGKTPEDRFYWGDGFTSNRILNILRSELL